MSIKPSHRRILTLEKQAQRRQQNHLKRLQNIASSKKAKSTLDNHSGIQKKHVRNRNILEQKRIKAENDRLCRRLSQINDRKNSQWKKLQQQDNYCSINQKSREIYRKQKQMQIKFENNLFVERILDKVGHRKSIFTGQNIPTLKKSRKKNHSLALATLQV